jgi:predicted porin
MNKKLIALAVAGATLAPVAAMAQTANPVTLYGRAYATVESIKADGGPTGTPALGSRTRVTDNASFFGIRGTEDLGGIKAFFQLESVFRVDQTGSSFANRNSGVGLQGDFGSFLIGRWDTPFKSATIAVDPFGDLTVGGLTTVMNDRTNFDRRDNNVIQYWSPSFGGFQVRAAYATNEGKTAAANPSGVSLSGTYTQGPFYAGYAYEKHKDQFKAYGNATALATVAGADERGQAFFGTATFGPVKIGLLQEYFLKNAAPGTVSRKNGNVSTMAAITYTIGNNQIAFSHAQAKDGTVRIGTGGGEDAKCTANVLGYFYNFSRRTSFIGQYANIKNNDRGQCDAGGDRLGIAAGQDLRGLSAGFRHTF